MKAIRALDEVAEMGDEEEQRATLEALMTFIDEEPLSKLFAHHHQETRHARIAARSVGAKRRMTKRFVPSPQPGR